MKSSSAVAAALALALIATMVWTPRVAALGPRTIAVFDSEPGDYIGGGMTQVFTSADSTFVLRTSSGNGVTVNVVRDDAVYFTGVTSQGHNPSFGVGTWEAAGRGGLDVSGPAMDYWSDGRGCNASGGRFVVHEFEVDADQTPTSFALTFVQHCERGIPALFGEIRYNSAFPLTAVAASPRALVLTPSVAELVTVSNVGSTASSLQVSIVGRDREEFALAGTGCPATLDAGASCSVEVVADPRHPGERRAELLILDETARGRRQVLLSSQGPPAGQVFLTADDTSVPYGIPVELHIEVPGAVGGTLMIRSGDEQVSTAPLGPEGRSDLSVLLPAGNHWILAGYGGSTALGAAWSAPLRVVVTD